MGNTQKGGGIGSKINHFFTDTVGIKKAYNYVANGISHVVGVIHDDAKSYIKGVSNLVVRTEDALVGTVKEVSHDVTGLGIAVSGDVKDLGVGVTKNISTMAWPLAIGAAVIGGVMLMKK